MSKVMILSSNVIGKTMAGPAIRCWEMAKDLSKKHEVVLVSPKSFSAENMSFKAVVKGSKDYFHHLRNTDVIILQNVSPRLALQARKYGIKIVVDAYDPVPLEVLELFQYHPPRQRKRYYQGSLLNTNFNLNFADAIICASEKQRDLWLGALLSKGLISLEQYQLSSSLRHFIDVVPFGLSSETPQKNGSGLREKYQFSAKDKVLLWGGGIWNWFDPLTLIKAMEKIVKRQANVKLVFMGIKNPDPSVPEMAMVSKAITLARDLNLLDRSVFFNHGWIPYEERQNFLLDADLGVSMHFDHLETRFSFRTRMLDYMWAKLPIVATEGDSFAELIKQNEIGSVVPPQDEEAIANSILTLLEDESRYEKAKERLEILKKEFEWERTLDPLHPIIEHLTAQPRKKLGLKDISTISSFVAKKIYNKLLF